MTVLCGSSTANGGTIITIPAGAVWVGQVYLSAALINNAGSSSRSDQPSITVQGSGSEFASGTIVARTTVGVSTAGALGLIGSSDSNGINGEVFIDNSSNAGSVTLQLNHASTAASGVAVGRY